LTIPQSALALEPSKPGLGAPKRSEGGIHMNLELKFFSDLENLRHLNRSFLTRLLEENIHCLPPEAAALLLANPCDFEYSCTAWAAQLFTRFLDRQSPDCTWSPEI